MKRVFTVSPAEANRMYPIKGDTDGWQRDVMVGYQPPRKHERLRNAEGQQVRKDAEKSGLLACQLITRWSKPGDNVLEVCPFPSLCFMLLMLMLFMQPYLVHVVDADVVADVAAGLWRDHAFPPRWSFNWPLRYSMVSWSATLKDLTPGKYEVRARAVDLNGFAPPEPRPILKSGKNPNPVRKFEMTVRGGGVCRPRRPGSPNRSARMRRCVTSS